MKKIILLCFGIMYLCIHTFGQLSDRVTFDPSSLKFTTENSYNKVSFENCCFIKEAGSPQLPYLTVNYLIPFDQKVSSIVISDSTSTALTGKYNIYPAQPERPINEPPAEFVNPNPAIYNSNTIFPSTLIEIVGQYYDKGYHIITLNIYPVSYKPLSKTLRLITSVSFTLNYEFEPNVSVKPAIQSGFMDDLVKRQMVSTVKNGTEINTLYDETTRTIESSDQQGNFFKSFTPESGFGIITPQYIIITNNTDVDGKPIPTYNGKNMTQTFQQLAEWKTKKGVPTHVITVDYIKSVSKGCDLEEKIHNYLADIYRQYGTIYILFGGDINIIPARMVINPNRKFYLSDLYYTAIENNWNQNGNDIFGESNDDADVTSEFYFGRALVEDAKEASIFINKVIDYETLNRCSNLNYIKNNLFIASYLWNRKETINGITNVIWYSDEIIKTNNFANSIIGENKWQLYDEYFKYNGNQELNLANVVNNLNNGQSFGKFHLIYHIDHSSYSNMGTSSLFKNQSLHRDDMDKLSNSEYLQILYSNGCEPGDFSHDCIIKHYLNNPNGGGVAAIASSDVSYASEMDYFKSIINILGKTTDNSEHFRSIGIVHDKSVPVSNLWYKRKNHLFGDPEMPIWTQTPKTFNGNITLSASSISNENNRLNITVKNVSAFPIKVCLFKDGDIYEVKYALTTVSGNGSPLPTTFSFDLSPQTSGTLTVTATANNYIPYSVNLPVQITCKNLYISSNTVSDLNGNNNQQIDAAETVNLNIKLKNNGTLPTTGVTAKLTCASPFATITNPLVAYGNININQEVLKNNFKISVSKDTPQNTILLFKLEITDDSGYKISRSFTYTVNTANISYAKNHYTSSGTQYTMFLEAYNEGKADAAEVTGILSCNSPDVVFSISEVNYGTIKQSETKTNTQGFKFTCSSNINDKQFVIKYRDKTGKTWQSNPFNLIKPENTVTGLNFQNYEHSITVKWKPVTGDFLSYNIYRSSSSNGTFSKINPSPITTASLFTDINLSAKTTYYYYVTYVNTNGNESQPSEVLTCWTSLPIHEGWPVKSSLIGNRFSGSPTTFDIDNDGYKEVFFTNASQSDTQIMSIFAFSHRGE